MKNCLKIIGVLLFVPSFTPAQSRIREKEALISQEPFMVNIALNKKDKMDSVNFRHVIFIDCRIDTSEIGSVLLDIKKGYRQLKFEGSVQSYFSKKLNYLVERGLTNDTLLIRLNDLWFGESISQASGAHEFFFGSLKRESNAYCNFELFTIHNESFRKIADSDTVFTDNGWLPNNVDKLAEKVVKYFIELGSQKEIKYDIPVDLASFESKSKPAIKPPILVDAQYKRGIYFSFQQFLDNAPEDVSFKKQDFKKNTRLWYKQAADTSKDLAWGFSDGENLYMHLDSMYYKLERKGSKFTTSAPLSIEIINTWMGFRKAMKFFTAYYFLYDPPFRLSAITEFVGPQENRVNTYYRYYDLNLCNGTLR